MNENLNDIIEYPAKGILSKQISKTQKIDVTLFCMAKGTNISDHTSTRQGFVFVLDGKGTFILKGKKISMIPGRFIFLENNAVHSLKAEQNTSFLLSLVN